MVSDSGILMKNSMLLLAPNAINKARRFGPNTIFTLFFLCPFGTRFNSWSFAKAVRPTLKVNGVVFWWGGGSFFSQIDWTMMAPP
jgi:hypothetical protein